MEDIAAVVVEGEDGAVGIPAVAHVPLLHLTDGHHHAEIVVFLQTGGLGYEALDGAGKEEPVGVGRLIFAQLLEFVDVALFRHVVQGNPQGVVGTDERLGNVGCIDKILTRGTPDQIVGRVGVNAVLVAGQRPFAQLAAHLELFQVGSRIADGTVGQGEPRRQTGHQAAEGLHVHHLAVAVVKRGRELGLHVLLQLAFGHVLQHGLRHFPGLLAPVFAVRQRCSLFLCTDNRNGTEEEKKGE